MAYHGHRSQRTGRPTRRAIPPAANPRLSALVPWPSSSSNRERDIATSGIGRPVCSCPIQGAPNAASPSVFAQLKPVTHNGLPIDVVPGGISSLEKVQIERVRTELALQNRGCGNRRIVPNGACWFPFCKNQPVSSAGRSKLIRGGVGRNLPNARQIQRHVQPPLTTVPIPTRRRPVPVRRHRAWCLIHVDPGCVDWRCSSCSRWCWS